MQLVPLNRLCRFVITTGAFIIACAAPSFAQTEPGTAVPLRFLWRANTGVDKFTTRFSSEALDWYFEGALFYVPGASATGRQLLLRLSIPSDHMDSTLAGEGGYNTEGDLGWPFTYQELGTIELVRKTNPSTGDHALSSDIDPLSGYTDERMGLFGYPRYGLSNEILLTNSAGGVTIKSNKNAGGALWEWYWNGMQFINHFDYGRLGQTSLFTAPLPSRSGHRANPTEAGGVAWAGGYGHGPLGQGSPVLEFNNSGTDQVTSSIPLDFNPGDFGGGSENPVIWQGMRMGKTITLNYAGLGAIAHYITRVYVPWSTGEIVEIPTVYLNGNFNRFYTYDADANGGAGQATEISNFTDQNGNHRYYFLNHGGVIASTSDGSYAFGIYAVSRNVGGSAAGFDMWEFIDGGPTGGDNNSCVKLNAFVNNPLSAGWNYYSSYLISGTLSDVCAKMHTLKDRNDN